MKILFEFIANKLVDIVVNIFLLSGILFVFYSESIVIGIIFTIFVIISLLLIYFTQKSDNSILYKEKEYSTSATSKYSEWLHMKKDIDMLNKATYVKEKIHKISDELLPVKVKAQKYLYKVWSLTIFLLAVANILTLFIGGKLFVNNFISIGMLYLVYSYSNLLKEPFENLQMQVQAILAVKVVTKRVIELVNYVPEVLDGDRSIVNIMPSIQFKNVSYFYKDSSKAALKNINTLINSGEVLGVEGSSGSGKSTFSKIICKLLEAKEGEILIDNINISEISVAELRRDIAYISIDSHIFNSSLKNNLTLFNENMSDDEVEQVLEQYDLIKMFKNGDKDFLSKVINGTEISSGQKQLICLCRILFKKKKIVIFDEASSRIDTEIEEIFYKILDDVGKKSTTIIISHHSTQLKELKRILTFKNGEIVNEKINV